MIPQSQLDELRRAVEAEACEHILPFWIAKTVDRQNGGFYGEVSGEGVARPDAKKGGILNSRILWTFAHSYIVYTEPIYKEMAEHAYRFLKSAFWDDEYGGVYWSVDYLGRPREVRKHTYAQAFAIYGLAEYYRVSGQAEALQKAIRIFELIEAHAHSDQNRGYWEACERDWHLAEDFRLSDLEPNAIKTMNTHLHILEAYTNLCQVWDDPGLVKRLKELIEVFIEHIIDPVTAHFRLFFDEDWHPQAGPVSYGHDIEGSWLLCEAVEVLGDERLISVVKALALRMAQAVYTHGLEEDGSLRNESNSDETEPTYKEWWVQAEAVVGFINAYQLSGEEKYLKAAWHGWEFIQSNVVDSRYGEWRGSLTVNGQPVPGPLVDFWKCPYHNSRMCFEVMRRLKYIRSLES